MTLDDFPPMLLVEQPIDLDPGWLFELKFHGYRVTAMFGSGNCKLRTRNGADASQWFPEVCRSLAAVKGGPYVTDGEVCVLDELGRPGDCASDLAKFIEHWSDRNGVNHGRPRGAGGRPHGAVLAPAQCLAAYSARVTE